MAATAESPLREQAFSDLEPELATTRRVLERLPEEHFGWKPHEKSMSLGRLAGHVVHLVHWHEMTLRTDELDLATAPPPPADWPRSRAELLDSFESYVAALRTALSEADNASLMRPWTLRMGEKVILARPKLSVLRIVCLNHMIHHRAQLCVYLRLLNIPVPSVYGPSADEPAGF